MNLPDRSSYDVGRVPLTTLPDNRAAGSNSDHGSFPTPEAVRKGRSRDSSV
jgi:hypothetical protein